MNATTSNASSAHLLQVRRYPQLSRHGERVPLNLKHGLALLAYLWANDGRASRSAMAGLLWPETGSGIGRTRLRRLIYQVNASAKTTLVAGDTDTLWLMANSLQCDAAETRVAARQVLNTDDGLPPEASIRQLLRTDAFLFMDSFSIDSDRLMDWLSRYRGEHERLVLRALLKLADTHFAQNEAEPAIEAAEQALRIDNCSERAHAMVLRARAMQGDAAGVEAAYLRCVAALRHELALSPSQLIEDAYAQAVKATRLAEAH
jgi:DNA-binding SARP family transcriptional activator